MFESQKIGTIFDSFNSSFYALPKQNDQFAQLIDLISLFGNYNKHKNAPVRPHRRHYGGFSVYFHISSCLPSALPVSL